MNKYPATLLKLSLGRGLLALPLLALILTACGGGGGGSGGKDTPLVVQRVLEFDIAGSSGGRYETASDTGFLSGELRSAFVPTLDCEDPNNYQPKDVMELRWSNAANGANGRTDIVVFCRDTGLIFGPGVFTAWAIFGIPLESGDNVVALTTFENGRQIGEDTFTIVRNGPATVTDQVVTSQGTLQGVIEGDLSVFRGVRYAAAPVGELRFKAPQSPPAFTGIADARQFAPVCVQPASAGPVGEEDCLFLNIWAHNDALVRPVIVFLHGGAAGGVGGDLPTTEGSALAEHGGAVVVTLNRRVGVMGYLALDELIQENPRTTAGNYGVLDVIAALRWIQDNIAQFNGNPNQVMLAGESAGAFNICHVVAAPEAAGLLQSVALQSGPCSLRIVLNDQIAEASRFEPALDLHRPLLSETGCDNAADVLACLRAVPAADVVAAGDRVPRAGTSTNPFSPIIDGVVVESNPYDALASEVVGSVPLIVGSNSDEARNIFANVAIPDDTAYRDFLATTFPDPLDDQLYDLYPTVDYGSARDAFLTLFGDLILSCVAEELAESAQTGAPSYLYTLSRGFDNGSLAGMGAVHGIDVPYLFETFGVFGYTPDAQALAISAGMQKAWIGLARMPNVAPPFLPQGSSSWPAFDAANVEVVDFGDPIAAVGSHRDGRCSQLSSLVTF